MASLQKNVGSQHFTFCMVNASTGAADTGATVAVKVTIDNGAQGTGAGTVTNKGGGQYDYAPTQAETNGNDCGFLLTAASDIPVNIDFHTDLTDATGNLQVDAVRINNVSTSPVTTIAANLGSAQPINFTGTGGTALAQTDVRDWLGTAVTAATAGIPDVNTKNINNISGSGVTTVSANMGTTQPINFTGTAGTALVQTDTRDWLGTVVATPATAGIPDINVKNISNAAVSTSTAQVGSNLVSINGNATAAVALMNSTLSICWGTASSGTTTTVVASAINNPATLTDVGQLIGRTIIFLGTTANTHVQAQASNITNSTSGATPTITFTAMTTAPAAGDLFVII